MTITTTPAMGLKKPGVGTSGSDWAEAINDSIDSIDSHDHSSAKGTRISQTGILFSDTFSYNDQGGDDVAFFTFTPQTVDPAVSSAYFKGNDFYIRTGSGGVVQLTASGGFNSALVGGIGGDYTLSAASLDYDSVNEKYVFYKTLTKYSDVHVGAITIFRDDEDPAGTYGTKIQSYASLAAGYTFTLPSALPASTSPLMVDSSGNCSFNSAPSVASFPLIAADGTWSYVGGAGSANKVLYINSSGTPAVAGTDAIIIPNGTELQRPASPSDGMIRYNSDTDAFEGYADSAWGDLGGVGGVVAWTTGDVYKVETLVSYNGFVFRVTTKHTAGATFDLSKMEGILGDIEVINSVSHSFSDLDVVYFDGTDWQLAQADVESTLADPPAMIVMTETDYFVVCKVPRPVYIASHGLTGDVYFLSDSSAGGISETSPAYSNPILRVLDANNLQILAYRPSTVATEVSVGELEYLADVTITTPSDGQALTYDNASSKWVNTTLSSTLEGLTDTTITTPSDGQLLKYDNASSKWVNYTPTPALIKSMPDTVVDITSSQTWTVPAGIGRIKIVGVGGGGNGASTSAGQYGGGGGGGGVSISVLDVTPSDSVSIDITSGTVTITHIPTSTTMVAGVGGNGTSAGVGGSGGSASGGQINIAGGSGGAGNDSATGSGGAIFGNSGFKINNFRCAQLGSTNVYTMNSTFAANAWTDPSKLFASNNPIVTSNYNVPLIYTYVNSTFSEWLLFNTPTRQIGYMTMSTSSTSGDYDLDKSASGEIPPMSFSQNAQLTAKAGSGTSGAVGSTRPSVTGRNGANGGSIGAGGSGAGGFSGSFTGGTGGAGHCFIIY